MSRLRALLDRPGLLRRTALASLVANVGIVITGGAVRLTRSGLGCPSWPQCDEKSLVTTQALGYHGAIEFGNRTLTSVAGILAVAGTVAQLHADLVMLLIGLSVGLLIAAPVALRRAAAVLVGVELAQGAIGFVQYFSHLPVLLVGLHMAGACAVWLATLNVLVAGRVPEPAPRALPPPPPGPPRSEPPAPRPPPDAVGPPGARPPALPAGNVRPG